jgi:plasmid maintenance system killer protein
MNDQQYEIVEHEEYTKSKAAHCLDSKYGGIVQRKLRFLANNPRHPSLECHPFHANTKLNGQDIKVWTFYVNNKGSGRLRICFVYTKNKKILLIDFSNHYNHALKDNYAHTSETP